MKLVQREEFEAFKNKTQRQIQMLTNAIAKIGEIKEKKKDQKPKKKGK